VLFGAIMKKNISKHETVTDPVEKYSPEYFMEKFHQEDTGYLLSKLSDPDISSNERETILAILKERNISEREAILSILEEQNITEEVSQYKVPPTASVSIGKLMIIFGLGLCLFGPLLWTIIIIEQNLPIHLFSNNFELSGHWLVVGAIVFFTPIGGALTLIGLIVILCSK
jgi:hypothetical protein